MMLLTNSIVSLAALVLTVVMVAAAYTHYKVKDPMGKVAIPAVLAVASLYVALSQRGAKKEKNE